jgi:hypothetical protein
MPGMPTKYKILWFVVDMHHRQRYFFICGCKRTVKKPGARPAGRPPREANSRLFQIPVSRFFARD